MLALIGTFGEHETQYEDMDGTEAGVEKDGYSMQMQIGVQIRRSTKVWIGVRVRL